MLSVLKLGGSVLRDEPSYKGAARFLQDRLATNQDERLVVIVSAQHGETNRLLAEAERITCEPASQALDLLWSTGELRSVALLTLHLQRLSIAAVPFNVHQTGLGAERATERGSAGPAAMTKRARPRSAAACSDGIYAAYERPFIRPARRPRPNRRIPTIPAGNVEFS